MFSVIISESRNSEVKPIAGAPRHLSALLHLAENAGWVVHETQSVQGSNRIRRNDVDSSCSKLQSGQEGASSIFQTYRCN